VWILLIAAAAADTLRGKYSTLIDEMLLNGYEERQWFRNTWCVPLSSTAFGGTSCGVGMSFSSKVLAML
jgi:hypothetical protein